MLNVEAGRRREGKGADREGGWSGLKREVGETSVPREAGGGRPRSEQLGAVQNNADIGRDCIDGRGHAKTQNGEPMTPALPPRPAGRLSVGGPRKPDTPVPALGAINPDLRRAGPRPVRSKP